MSVFIDQSSTVIIQGITGKIGRVFAERMARHYPNFAGGVTPGKKGQTVCEKPVFNTVKEAVDSLGANASIISVGAEFVYDAALEAMDAGIKTIWIYTDGLPVHKTLELVHFAAMYGATLIGPNSAGIVSPKKASMAELSEDQMPLREGPVGLVSKSGSLCYEVVSELHKAGFGFSTIACLGGDPVIGTTMKDALVKFQKDPETKAVVLLGEIGGTMETDCAGVIRNMDKPVFAYICGHCAPPAKKIGHAGALVSGSGDTASAKTKVLSEAGVCVAASLEELFFLLKENAELKV